MSRGNSGRHPCHTQSLAGKRWISVQQLRLPIFSRLPGLQEARFTASTAQLWVVQICLLHTGSRNSSMCFPWTCSLERTLQRGRLVGEGPSLRASSPFSTVQPNFPSLLSFPLAGLRGLPGGEIQVRVLTPSKSGVTGRVYP